MKKIENILIPLFIGLIVLISFLFFMYFSTFNYIRNDTAVWGAFGDYIGGLLNPIFAFLSFISLLVTLFYQNKQLQQNQEILQETIKAIEQNEKALSQNQEALEFNRIELENSNKQLELSARAHVEIEKTQKIQQFDMLFTTMLSELNNISEKLNDNHEIDKFYKVFDEDDDLISKQLKLRNEYKLTKYFILLFQILKMIKDNNSLDYDEKKKYSNIVRASIENPILQLLMLNCFCDKRSDNFKDFQILLEYFSVLEHMNFLHFKDKRFGSNFYLILMIDNYEKNTFDENIYLSNLRKSVWYDRFVRNNNQIVSKDSLLKEMIKNNDGKKLFNNFYDIKLILYFNVIDGDFIFTIEILNTKTEDIKKETVIISNYNLILNDELMSVKFQLRQFSGELKLNQELVNARIKISRELLYDVTKGLGSFLRLPDHHIFEFK